MFSPKIGEDQPILTHIFQMGWFNHQLESESCLVDIPVAFVYRGISHIFLLVKDKDDVKSEE